MREGYKRSNIRNNMHPLCFKRDHCKSGKEKRRNKARKPNETNEDFSKYIPYDFFK